jgi:branched-chain amino acid transport system permease protein
MFILLVLGFLFSLFAPRLGWISSYGAHVLITIGINIILCISLNLVNGYMGEFSIGHAGFMSLGAYTSAMITTKLPLLGDSIFLPSVLAGGIVAAGIGFLLALLSFKTRGDYLAIITLAFLMIVKSAFENLQFV